MQLKEIQFEAEAEDFYDSVDGLKAAMESDTVSSSQVQALLKLLATEAKGEVRSVAQAVETSVYSVLAAKDASVNELKRSAKFSAFGGVPSGPACSPIGILPPWLEAFGERACWWNVGLLVVSAFAGGTLFAFCW